MHVWRGVNTASAAKRKAVPLDGLYTQNFWHNLRSKEGVLAAGGYYTCRICEVFHVKRANASVASG